VRWQRGRGAGQIEDRRGAAGGLGRLGAGGGGIGLLVLLAYLLLGGGLPSGGGGGFGIDPQLDPFPQASPPAGDGGVLGARSDDDAKEFVAFVVDDVQTEWRELFSRAGRTYEPTTLVLFTSAVQTGCGGASSATGPFYCPLDRKVYVDLGFFRELERRFGAPGDFAQAYVIAHEFGHHVQTLLGVNEQVRREQQSDPGSANELSVRMELQADCLAGVWAHTAYRDRLLEEGDLEEGLNAAASVGDDRIQRQTSGRVDPESWTHGSSEQRVKWFRRGFDGGDPGACDTFSGDV
jgi:predicted metalloprotease